MKPSGRVRSVKHEMLHERVGSGSAYDVQRLPSHRPASLDSLALVKPTLTTNSSERTENGRNHLVKNFSTSQSNACTPIR